jgi:hypothetical protein
VVEAPWLPDFFGTTYQNGKKIFWMTKNVPSGH